ncbi:FXYD domain containing ion transport regulator 6 like isoform X2 [Alosa pseudoharengus]|uniref:FXYD domain containing ion transport regulator 6 like isoform X2 n=1 Tax=Alosa pseudoharengus TaxID=34774 RepID=UPI003F8B5D3E
MYRVKTNLINTTFSSLIQVGMDLSVLAAFCACLGPALASSMSHDDYDSPFHYDYESLRIGGLVFAVTLCIVGLLLIFTRKCTCK